jgi:ketosteroid isomerase-like protein
VLLGCASRASAEDESRVLAAIDALHAAGLHRDVAALERLYSRDYFHTNPDGSRMGRHEVLASYRNKPEMTLSSSDAAERSLLVRESFAVVSERLSLHGRTAHGDRFVSNYRVTYVLERAGDGWRFVNSHATLLGIDKSPQAEGGHP